MREKKKTALIKQLFNLTGLMNKTLMRKISKFNYSDWWIWKKEIFFRKSFLIYRVQILFETYLFYYYTWQRAVKTLTLIYILIKL